MTLVLKSRDLSPGLVRGTCDYGTTARDATFLALRMEGAMSNGCGCFLKAGEEIDSPPQTPEEAEPC